MDSRKFTLAMRLVDFVERLSLQSPDGDGPPLPAETGPAPKPQSREQESPFMDDDTERRLADAVNMFMGGDAPPPPPHQAPQTEVDLSEEIK